MATDINGRVGERRMGEKERGGRREKREEMKMAGKTETRGETMGGQVDGCYLSYCAVPYRTSCHFPAFHVLARSVLALTNQNRLDEFPDPCFLPAAPSRHSTLLCPCFLSLHRSLPPWPTRRMWPLPRSPSLWIWSACRSTRWSL